MWTLGESVAAVGGRLVGADGAFSAVVTDSRRDCSGELFVALRGDRFDGHDYVAAAGAAGAAAAMVDHPLPVAIPQWVVDDTRLGLGRLASAWRDRFRGRVAAITGSNGKTTVKEMVAAILAQAGSVLATRGNLNNDIGMPLTLLKARDENFLVLEMGANHAGEIGYMTDIGRPDVALITSAGRAHLEGFGSLEGVARAKGEIARGLPRDGTFVFGADSPYTPLWHQLADGRRVLTFGVDADGDLRVDGESIRVDWGDDGFLTRFVVRHGAETIPLELRLAGRHNVHNALAATGVALALGVGCDAVRDGLASITPVAGRLCPRRGAGPRVIDDTYNANPDSLAAAIAVLAGIGGRRWLVLGDLRELGPEAASLHREIGERARAAGIDRLVSSGTLSAEASDAFGDGGRHFDETPRLIDWLRTQVGPDDVLLVKGSRLARMERVVDALCGKGDD